MALNITIDNALEFTYEENDGVIQLDGKAVPWDMTETEPGKFHILSDGNSYNAELISLNQKEMTIKVEGELFSIAIKDQYDQLLTDLGMDAASAKKLNNIVAPMPGLVVEVMVKEGDEVYEGDSVLILSAMKMENVIKAAGNGTVKAVSTKKDDAVEKGQVLIEFGG